MYSAVQIQYMVLYRHHGHTFTLGILADWQSSHVVHAAARRARRLPRVDLSLDSRRGSASPLPVRPCILSTASARADGARRADACCIGIGICSLFPGTRIQPCLEPRSAPQLAPSSAEPPAHTLGARRALHIARLGRAATSACAADFVMFSARWTCVC